jgi:mannose-6-phosphate isomerase
VEIYPIKVKPILKETVWGGKKLSAMFGAQGKQIGEAWFFADIESGRSVISNGPLKGIKLGEAVSADPSKFLGPKLAKKYGKRFPLLFKYLDSHEKLSVQVHPSDRLAEKYGEKSGKTEMWHILHAVPGALIWAGFTKKPNKDHVWHAALTGSLDSMLNKFSTKPGDSFFVPAGCVHALGMGNFVFEIQQNADITYRLYDWGRLYKGRPRELHVEKAVNSIGDCRPKDIKIRSKFIDDGAGLKKRLLKECPFFEAVEYMSAGDVRQSHKGGVPFVAAVFAGKISVTTDNGEYEIKNGELAFFPYALRNFTMNISGGAHFIITEVK